MQRGVVSPPDSTELLKLLPRISKQVDRPGAAKRWMIAITSPRKAIANGPYTSYSPGFTDPSVDPL